MDEILNKSIITKLFQEKDLMRRELIKKIQNITKRKLITYIADFSNPVGIILFDDVILLEDILSSIDYPKNLDVVLHSPGGIVEATEKIVLVLRDHVENLRIIVPEAAKSAATLFCLASDEILMSHLSELGPIDPQIYIGFDPTTGQPIFRPAWSYLNSLDRMEDELKKGRDPSLVITLVAKIDPTLIDVAKNAIDYAKRLSENWLTTYMKIDLDKSKSITNRLSDASFYLTHGRTIRFREAKELGLKVELIDNSIWKLIHELHLRSRSFLLETKSAKLIESENASLTQK